MSLPATGRGPQPRAATPAAFGALAAFWALAAFAPLAGCSDPATSTSDGGIDAAPPVDAGPVEVALHLFAPPAPPIGSPFPIAIATADGSPASGTVTLQIGDGGPTQTVALYRGRGSASAIATAAGPLLLSAAAAGGTATLTVYPELRPYRDLSGDLDGAGLFWDATADIHLTAATTVPLGATLDIAPGTRVLVDPKVSLTVRGSLVSLAGEDDPIPVPTLFTRAGDGAWGGIRLLGGTADLSGTWFLAGGGDDSLPFGHSASQPVLYAEAGAITMQHGGVLDSPGKAFGTAGARISLDGVLISRCDTGGQLDDSLVTIQRSHFLEIPDADRVVDDDDNDGVYIKGAFLLDGIAQPSVVRDSVFAVGEDDAIDHNESLLTVERVWIETFTHEGVAASEGRSVTVADSVIRDCDQGVEAGYGDPTVTVEHTLITGCNNGLRYGDSYDWEVAGSLTATGVIVVGNGHNVWNWVNAVGGPVDGAIAIECSMVDDPAWDGRNRNLSGTPDVTAEGCLAAGSPGAGGACDGSDVGPRCAP
jgi:hypothetical protein